MSKKRRLKEETLEKRRLNPIKPDVARDETIKSETVVLLKTFLNATELSFKSIVFLILFIRLLSWLDAVEWSQSRCNLLSPSDLKTTDLKYLLHERRVDSLSELSRQDLETALWETGGVMEIEMEVLLEPDNNNNFLDWGVQRFDTWNEFQDGVPRQSAGVYLVLCSSELERKVTELNRWRKFLYRLSKNGVNFVLVKCDADGDCDSPKVMLLSVWSHRRYRSSKYASYKGPMQPSDILRWITKTLSAHVLHANSTTDVFSERYKSFPTLVVAHYTRPLPLSYSILASELRDRVSFFWVETLDLHLPDRASLIVLSPGSSVTYHKTRFLNQSEIRWLLKLLVMDFVDFYNLVVLFLTLVAFTILPLVKGGVWQMLKAIIGFLLLCAFGAILILKWLIYYKNVAVAIKFLITWLTKAMTPCQPELLLLFHLFAESPFRKFVFPIYALTVTFSTRICRFLKHLLRPNTSDSARGKSLKPVSSTTSTGSVSKTTGEILSHATAVMVEMSQNVNKLIGKFVYNSTKAVINMPFDFAKTIAKIARNITEATIKMTSNVAKTTTQVPSNVSSEVDMTTKTTDGSNGHETKGPPVTNCWVTQSQSLKSQYSAPSAGLIQHGPAVLSCPSHRPMRPLEYQTLVDSSNRNLDKSSMQQVDRLKNPKIWILPVISHKELKQLVLALQKLEAHDQRSFESTSRTVPRCFYCGTDFEPTSEVLVLPCQDIFHPGCMDEWMSGQH